MVLGAHSIARWLIPLQKMTHGPVNCCLITLAIQSCDMRSVLDGIYFVFRRHCPSCETTPVWVWTPNTHIHWSTCCRTYWHNLIQQSQAFETIVGVFWNWNTYIMFTVFSWFANSALQRLWDLAAYWCSGYFYGLHLSRVHMLLIFFENYSMFTHILWAYLLGVLCSSICLFFFVIFEQLLVYQAHSVLYLLFV